MEKVDVLGLAIVVLGIFTFINIIAIRSIFYIIDKIRCVCDNIINCINDNNLSQNEVNAKQTEFIIKLAEQVGCANEVIMAILKMIQRSNNHNSPTGGQETSN